MRIRARLVELCGKVNNDNIDILSTFREIEDLSRAIKDNTDVSSIDVCVALNTFANNFLALKSIFQMQALSNTSAQSMLRSGCKEYLAKNKIPEIADQKYSEANRTAAQLIDIGCALFDGKGIKKNIQSAREYFEKAAKTPGPNQAIALHNVGVTYQYDNPPNYELAKSLYEQALNGGHKEAANKLAKIDAANANWYYRIAKNEAKLRELKSDYDLAMHFNNKDTTEYLVFLSFYDRKKLKDLLTKDITQGKAEMSDIAKHQLQQVMNTLKAGGGDSSPGFLSLQRLAIKLSVIKKDPDNQVPKWKKIGGGITGAIGGALTGAVIGAVSGVLIGYGAMFAGLFALGRACRGQGGGTGAGAIALLGLALVVVTILFGWIPAGIYGACRAIKGAWDGGKAGATEGYKHAGTGRWFPGLVAGVKNAGENVWQPAVRVFGGEPKYKVPTAAAQASTPSAKPKTDATTAATGPDEKKGSTAQMTTTLGPAPSVPPAEPKVVVAVDLSSAASSSATATVSVARFSVVNGISAAADKDKPKPTASAPSPQA